MSWALLWVALAVSSNPSIPARDVNAHCGKLGITLAINQCIEQEQDAYDWLKEIWPESPAEIRAECLGLTAHTFSDLHGIWAYIALQACLEPRLERWRLAQPHGFRP